ncbi:MAG: type II toxin-antitoxin system HicB family antitoxin [Patescibacteria group bacterium]|nr:type II toxin-antitoxin system HicB family antitoxin [Patescibacteria group bacterium]
MSQYYVLFETEDNGTITVSVPSLPGCYSNGQTIEEATSNIQEAIQLYLSVAKERNEQDVLDHDDSRVVVQSLMVNTSSMNNIHNYA